MEAVTDTGTKKNGHVASGTVVPPIVMALAVGEIDESPSNPRKTFSGVEDLAEDLKRRGVLQPVLVRPSPTAMGRYELVFGARRFRATKLARIAEIPAMVRSLTDEEVLEIQIVENSKREDIHPMEEADGYRALHETHAWPIEEIAAKVGRAIPTVRQRLKLCGLVVAARAAFLANRFTAGVALVLARIPHADQQGKALDEILQRQGDSDDPMTVADAGWLVEAKYMLVLADAPFDRSDASLVAGVPDCGACPKRTGNQREPFPDISAKNDLCTDTRCWDGKKDATWDKKLAEARATGTKVLSKKEASALFAPYSENPVIGSDFVDLAAVTYDRAGKSHDNRTLIGKAAGVPVILARDPSGRTRELVAAADFKAAAKAAGNGAVIPSMKPASVSAIDAAGAKEVRAKAEKKRERFQVQLDEIVAWATVTEPNESFWRVLARGLVIAAYADLLVDVCKGRDIEIKAKPYEKAAEARKRLLALVAILSGGEARGLVVELVAATGRGGDGEAFKAFATLYPLEGGKRKRLKAPLPRASTKKKAAKPARKKR